MDEVVANRKVCHKAWIKWQVSIDDVQFSYMPSKGRKHLCYFHHATSIGQAPSGKEAVLYSF